MILSSLVNPDPDGYIRLDENLARHIGARNVDAFHDEAGDITINEFLNNPVIVREMTRNTAIMDELDGAVARQYKAPSHEVSVKAKDGVRNMLKTSLAPQTRLTSGGAETYPSIQVRAILANELLVNPVINDATMRNPTIMRELSNAVTKLFETRKAAFSGTSSRSSKGGKSSKRTKR